ncbi:MAG: hypothetical protein ABL997_10450 [Planctomycetota bacterium]
MPTTDVTSLQRRLREWTLQPSTERNFYRGPVRMVEDALDDPRRVTQLSISGYLLGTWYLGCGELAVLEGDPTGWDRIRLGVAFQRTALWLRCTKRTNTRRGEGADLPVLQTANCAALVLAFHDPEGEELLEAFADLPDDRFGENDAWPYFVRELLGLRHQRRPVIARHLGPYGEVLQAFTGDDLLLGRRLEALCDHHLDHTRGTPSQPAEFDEPGIMLVPAAVLAVRAVRTSLDLRTPKVEHSMMFTNLVQTTAEGAFLDDPLLQRMRAAVPRKGGGRGGKR